MMVKISDISLNALVELCTIDGKTTRNRVYCPGHGDSLVLDGAGSTTYYRNIMIVKPEYVQSFKEIQRPPAADVEQEVLPIVDLERTKMREERAIRFAKIEASKIGAGVTEEAQMVFNALSKTLPCRWEGQKIIVLEEVEIIEPYNPENCRSLLSGDTTAIDRVRKVIEEERKNIF